MQDRRNLINTLGSSAHKICAFWYVLYRQTACRIRCFPRRMVIILFDDPEPGTCFADIFGLGDSQPRCSRTLRGLVGSCLPLWRNMRCAPPVGSRRHTGVRRTLPAQSQQRILQMQWDFRGLRAACVLPARVGRLARCPGSVFCATGTRELAHTCATQVASRVNRRRMFLLTGRSPALRLSAAAAPDAKDRGAAILTLLGSAQG